MDIQAEILEIQDAANRFGGIAGAVNPAYGSLDMAALGYPEPQAAAAAFVVGWQANGTVLSEVCASANTGLGRIANNYQLAELLNSGGSGGGPVPGTVP